MIKNLILFGGGGHCRSILDVLSNIKKIEPIAVIDEKLKLEKLDNIRVFKSLKELGLNSINNDCYFVISFGMIKINEQRKDLFNLAISLGLIPISIISNESYISKKAIIGKGSVIMHGAILNTQVEIGNNCIINTKALLDHGCKIGDHSHISTGSILNGDVIVGKNCFIGSGAIIRESVEIKDNSFIKAGALVTKSI